MIKNILVTSIGSFSASCTFRSLKRLDNLKIYGCDIYPAEWHHISSSFDAVFLAPLVKDEMDYKEFIDGICRQYNIQLIIPLTDVEVDFFNKYRNYYHNNNIITTIANPTFLSISRDKYALYRYSETIDDLSQVPTYKFEELSNNSEYPLIAKVVNGRSSEGLYLLKSIKDVKKNLDNSRYIYQKVIQGQIATVDYVRSDFSRLDFCIPRWEHLRTKNGAGMTVEIFHSNEIEKIVSEIGNDLDINGCVNFEFIINENGFHLIDVNPRFSAGIGFSMLAGYDFIESHLNCFTGKDILPAKMYKNMILEKKMEEVVNLIKCENE